MLCITLAGVDFEGVRVKFIYSEMDVLSVLICKVLSRLREHKYSQNTCFLEGVVSLRLFGEFLLS